MLTAITKHRDLRAKLLPQHSLHTNFPGVGGILAGQSCARAAVSVINRELCYEARSLGPRSFI